MLLLLFESFSFYLLIRVILIVFKYLNLSIYLLVNVILIMLLNTTNDQDISLHILIELNDIILSRT